MRKSKWLALLVVAVMAMSLFAGCVTPEKDEEESGPKFSSYFDEDKYENCTITSSITTSGSSQKLGSIVKYDGNKILNESSGITKFYEKSDLTFSGFEKNGGEWVKKSVASSDVPSIKTVLNAYKGMEVLFEKNGNTYTSKGSSDVTFTVADGKLSVLKTQVSSSGSSVSTEIAFSNFGSTQVTLPVTTDAPIWDKLFLDENFTNVTLTTAQGVIKYDGDKYQIIREDLNYTAIFAKTGNFYYTYVYNSLTEKWSKANGSASDIQSYKTLINTIKMVKSFGVYAEKTGDVFSIVATGGSYTITTANEKITRLVETTSSLTTTIDFSNYETTVIEIPNVA